MKFKFIIVICLLTVFIYSCKKTDAVQQIKVSEITFTHEGNLQLLDSTQTVIKNLKIEIANNDYEHQTGLMHRKQMDNDQAMLFIFKDDDIRIRSFYMKNTYIPLDIIFIDTNLKIINIAQHAKPLDETSIFSEAPAKYVLEINAGLSEKWNLKAGNMIQYTTLP